MSTSQFPAHRFRGSELPPQRSLADVRSIPLDVWAVGLIFILAAAIRFATIAHQSYWTDEALTVYEVKLPFGGMLHTVAHIETTPPLYFALIFIVLLSIDVVKGFCFNDPKTGHAVFGMGVGSLVLLLNVVLIGGYTLGCHSFRHLVAGVLDTFSKAPLRKKVYDCASCLNRHHPKWAWCSLVWVGLTDVYIRLCSMGVIHDLRIF